MPSFDRMAVGATQRSDEQKLMSVPQHYNCRLAVHTKDMLLIIPSPQDMFNHHLRTLSLVSNIYQSMKHKPSSPTRTTGSFSLSTNLVSIASNPERESPNAKNYCASSLFMHFLLAIPDVSHPQLKYRSFGVIGCLVLPFRCVAHSLSLSLLCLPIWAVLQHLYMYMVAFLALRILYVVALVCFVFVR